MATNNQHRREANESTYAAKAAETALNFDSNFHLRKLFPYRKQNSSYDEKSMSFHPYRVTKASSTRLHNRHQRYSDLPSTTPKGPRSQQIQTRHRRPDFDRSPSRQIKHEDSPDPFESHGSRFSDIPKRLPASQRADCDCPINFYCRHKGFDEHDCRTLVPEREWGRWWHEQRDRETYAERPEVSIKLPLASTIQLQRIIGLCDNVERAGYRTPNLRKNIDAIIKWLQYVRRSRVTADLLEASAGNIVQRLERFLVNRDTSIANQGVPVQILEELTMITREWSGNNFRVDFSGRAPILTSIQQRNINIYPQTKSARVFGDNDLENGQMFSNREAMVRAGAHSSCQAGICGTVEDGAWAVVMGYHDVYKHEYYADIDEGDVVWYMGTALPAEADDDTPTNVKDHVDGTDQQSIAREPTKSTKTMMASLATKNPVRMFRSSKLARINIRRPYEGYRYDGLYVVIGMELLDAPRQIYRFKMIRIEGQGPLRY